MSKLLYVTANPKSPDTSYSLSVGQTFLEAYKAEHAQDEVEILDLYETEIPYIDGHILSGWGKLQQGESFDKLTDEEKSKVGRLNEISDQFVSADKIVFVTPLWNFSFPPLMKAYIDSICIAGKTFKYTENGPVGLLNDKKVLHIQARGGIYSEGPVKDFEMGDRHIRAIMSFIGIHDVETLAIEGVNFFPEKAQEIKEEAIAKAKELATTF
ncbi:FMN-dependent NADH-azoreductase [Longirhabdus pacifica]|uniref:FMN-dependent NADH-azoreductase n=1 Tax=Longirhabdus pacifica TaxID=2305227 RepID=UPI001008BBCF|nr:FMN-dependent NADH-azoreductase [Longirhabdus pacifica]